MKQIIIMPLCLLFLAGAAQHSRELGVALTNNNSAYPFSKFGGLFQSPFHPGVELSYGFNWKTKPKHDWYQQIKLAYFYHRFVQHGIELYTNAGCRYKFSPSFFIESAIGAGYLHSIPATAKLKLHDDGVYKNNKGIGRMQFMFVFNLGAGYTFNPKAPKPISAFVTYQQRIQAPFVQSYVPLLPYNSLMIGAKINLKQHSQGNSKANSITGKIH
jgi:hypothetical protein